jgi:hypothetical protein
MKTLSKALVGTIAAGALAVSAATPSLARDRHGDGVDAGDVIAGALVVGGIAAIASAASNRDGSYYSRAGYGDNYGGRYGTYGNYGRYDGYGSGNPRAAVEQCVRAVERDAGRYSYGRNADVTDVRSVRETRYGYEVRGRVAVNQLGRGWRNGDGNYGRGWNNDYRGWNNNLRGYDAGNFECTVERGRIVDLDIDGIRNYNRGGYRSW